MSGHGRGSLKRFLFGFGLLSLMLASPLAAARDAAFLDPGSGAGGASEEAVKVEPKAEIDIGETTLNVSKRTSIFFVNQTNQPIKIEKVVVNNDSNVVAEATANDCTKLGEIAASSRCSVEISVTATSPGPWSVDVLMTHAGAGRIARAKLTGKTTGSGSTENKGSGLAVAGREIKPVDFGDVTVGNGKTVRSTLMVNDSPEPITIYSIDVIEADNGLQRLDQGCAVDMELEPGSSCPVTLLWVPKNGGPISTDLIIRHSGRLGFAVVPVRGSAHGAGELTASSTSATEAPTGGKGVPPPPSATELEKAMAGAIPKISTAELGGGGSVSGEKPASDGKLRLIGTVGNRALLLKSDGETEVMSAGAEMEDGGNVVKLVSVGAHSADLLFDGKKRTLQLSSSPALVARAARQGSDEGSNKASVSTISGGIKK